MQITMIVSGKPTLPNFRDGMMLPVAEHTKKSMVNYTPSVRPPNNVDLLSQNSYNFLNISRLKVKGMMISSIFLLTLALSVDCCPTGGDTFWVELGNSCYSISRDPMDWGTAQEVGNILQTLSS